MLLHTEFARLLTAVGQYKNTIVRAPERKDWNPSAQLGAKELEAFASFLEVRKTLPVSNREG